MKTTLTTLLLITLMSSCNKTKYEKPFVIIGKVCDNWYYKGKAQFSCQDKNGKRIYFKDSCNKYQIGDTIQ